EHVGSARPRRHQLHQPLVHFDQLRRWLDRDPGACMGLLRAGPPDAGDPLRHTLRRRCQPFELMNMIRCRPVALSTKVLLKKQRASDHEEDPATGTDVSPTREKERKGFREKKWSFNIMKREIYVLSPLL